MTRPAAHGLGLPLDKVGLITLDAHFDMRETDSGPMNGNPVRCLLEDGMPGANICQIGLAPFANTRKMDEDAAAAGIDVYDMSDSATGSTGSVDEALEQLDAARVEAIMVDFDIDVIDRAQCPGAPGARPGGLARQPVLRRRPLARRAIPRSGSSTSPSSIPASTSPTSPP